MKVIDSSSLIKYIAREENWEEVEEHIREGCITLDLAVKETANALLKKTFKGEVDIETVKEILNCIPKIVRVTSQKEHLPIALEIAVKHKRPIYDALFIALSASTKTSLLTSDEEQVKVSKEHEVTAIFI